MIPLQVAAAYLHRWYQDPERRRWVLGLLPLLSPELRRWLADRIEDSLRAS